MDEHVRSSQTDDGGWADPEPRQPAVRQKHVLPTRSTAAATDAAVLIRGICLRSGPGFPPTCSCRPRHHVHARAATAVAVQVARTLRATVSPTEPPPGQW